MHLLKRLLFITRPKVVHNQLFSYTKYKNVLFNFQNIITRSNCQSVDNEIYNDDNSLLNQMYDALSTEFIGSIMGTHRVVIIQPYIKWGREKNRITTPKLQLSEAEALVKTMPFWIVVHKMFAPLLSFNRQQVLGPGNIKMLKQIVLENNATAIFFSLNGLKYYQAKSLREELQIEVFDRYSLIIHIFRLHAMTPEAKLQVALAELPYVRRQINSMVENKKGAINLTDQRKKILESQESKLRKRLAKLEIHRNLQRSKRKHSQFATVAVVGYTNAGKTSLIKALTGSTRLQPRNQLFATLDTTVHEGILPCRMKVLFVDTIGFIQDVPEMLIEPFKVTLEDALISDIIIHVYDVSHPDKTAQTKHVVETLKSLYIGREKQPIIINVANKCDLLYPDSEKIPESDVSVVSTDSTGIDILRHRIQEAILTHTGRQVMTMRVKSGSPAEAWLYKEMTVTHAKADENDAEYSMLNVVTTELLMHKFKKYLKEKKSYL